MRYQDGNQILLGDSIEFSGAPAVVVAIGPTDEYSPSFPKSEWNEVIGDGFLIRFENGSVLRLDRPEDCEDLKLIDRR